MPEQTQQEPASKRDAILAVACALFEKKGYEETTIADIARAANMAVGTVYLYFRNKHEIYTAVALSIEARTARIFRDPALLALPLKQMLRTMIDTLFRESRQQMSLMALLQVDIHSPEEMLQHKEAHQAITDALAEIFQRAIDRGELAPFNTEMYAQLLNLMGSSLLHQCFAIEKGEREELFRTYFIEFVERLCFGPPLRQGYPTPPSLHD